MNKTKSPLKSKTLWVNLLGIIAMLAQSKFGYLLAVEDQAVILAGVNLALRLITREPLNWTAPLKNNAGRARNMLVAALLCFSLAAAVAILPFLGGCSMATHIANDDIAAQLVVRAAAGRVLDQRPDWVTPAYDITSEMIALVQNDPQIDLATLEQAVINRVDWDQLNPEEQALLQLLISAARTDLEQALEKRGIREPGQVQIQMVRVLGWINQAAEIRRAVHAG